MRDVSLWFESGLSHPAPAPTFFSCLTWQSLLSLLFLLFYFRDHVTITKFISTLALGVLLISCLLQDTWSAYSNLMARNASDTDCQYANATLWGLRCHFQEHTSPTDINAHLLNRFQGVFSKPDLFRSLTAYWEKIAVVIQWESGGWYIDQRWNILWSV